MVEYLYDAIRVTAGEDFSIAATIPEETGEEKCTMTISDKEGNAVLVLEGEYDADNKYWMFTAEHHQTEGFSGHYQYCICDRGVSLQFEQPLYFV
jgi:hypothetical protein